MATISRSFTLLESPERIWAVLSDFPRWNRLFAMRDARRRGWGDRFAVRAGSGAGMQLAMVNAETELFQEWIVDEWTEPSRLRLSSRSCYGSANTHMRSAFQFDLAPVSSSETRVQIRFESEFSHPLWSLFLFWVPLRGDLTRVVEKMERGLADALTS